MAASLADNATEVVVAAVVVGASMRAGADPRKAVGVEPGGAGAAATAAAPAAGAGWPATPSC